MDVRERIEALFAEIPPKDRPSLKQKDLQYYTQMMDAIRAYLIGLQINDANHQNQMNEVQKQLETLENYCINQSHTIAQYKHLDQIMGKIKIQLKVEAEDEILGQIEAIQNVQDACHKTLRQQLNEVLYELKKVKSSLNEQKTAVHQQIGELDDKIVVWQSTAWRGRHCSVPQCLSVIADLKNTIEVKTAEFNRANALNEKQITSDAGTIQQLHDQIVCLTEELRAHRLRTAIKDETNYSEVTSCTLLSGGTECTDARRRKPIKELESQNEELQLQRIGLLQEVSVLKNENRRLKQLQLAVTPGQQPSDAVLQTVHSTLPHNRRSEMLINENLHDMLKQNGKAIFTLDAQEQIDKLRGQVRALKKQVTSLSQDNEEYRRRAAIDPDLAAVVQRQNRLSGLQFAAKSRLEAEAQTQRQTIQDQQKKIQGLELQVRRLSGSLSDNASQALRISKQADALKRALGEREDCEAALRAQRGKAAAMERERDQERARCRESTEVAEGLRRRNEELEGRVARLLQGQQALEQRVVQFGVDNELLKAQAATLRAGQDDALRECRRLAQRAAEADAGKEEAARALEAEMCRQRTEPTTVPPRCSHTDAIVHVISGVLAAVLLVVAIAQAVGGSRARRSLADCMDAAQQASQKFASQLKELTEQKLSCEGEIDTLRQRPKSRFRW